MSAPTVAPHAPPHWRRVVREQLAVLVLALRVPMLVGAGLLVAATVLVLADRVRLGVSIDFRPELSMIPGMAGLLLPLGTWLGDHRFGTAFPWTLPVERRALALARVSAGWLWLMAATLVFLAWLVLMAVVTGGEVLAEELMRVLPTTAVPSVVDPATLREVRWAPGPIIWLVPFTAATGAYLLGSALALGTRRPLRWLGGIALGAVLLSLTGVAADSDTLKFATSNLVEAVVYGPYGFDTLLTARTESLRTLARMPDGQQAVVWRAVPTLGRWAIATAGWTIGGFLLLMAAAARHRERRR